MGLQDVHAESADTPMGPSDAFAIGTVADPATTSFTALSPMQAGGNLQQQSHEIEQLRAQLAAEAPRLKAFTRLEALARERRSTPEAVAVQVTIDVLEIEQGELEGEVDRLAAMRTEYESEIAMLTRKREERVLDVEVLAQEHADLAAEAAELLSELDSIRSDAVRLMGEKAALEIEVAALRTEAGLLSGERSDRRSSGGHHPELHTVRSNPMGADAFDTSDEGAEATAFGKFFDADTGEDKARAWMLK